MISITLRIALMLLVSSCSIALNTSFGVERLNQVAYLNELIVPPSGERERVYEMGSCILFHTDRFNDFFLLVSEDVLARATEDTSLCIVEDLGLSEVLVVQKPLKKLLKDVIEQNKYERFCGNVLFRLRDVDNDSNFCDHVRDAAWELSETPPPLEESSQLHVVAPFIIRNDPAPSEGIYNVSCLEQSCFFANDRRDYKFVIGTPNLYTDYYYAAAFIVDTDNKRRFIGITRPGPEPYFFEILKASEIASVVQSSERLK